MYNPGIRRGSNPRSSNLDVEVLEKDTHAHTYINVYIRIYVCMYVCMYNACICISLYVYAVILLV